MYLQHFVFLDEDSTVTTSNALQINSKAETLKLSVEGDGTLSVTMQGKIDYDSDTFYNIAAVNLADMSIVSTITASGLYAIDAQGIKSIQCVNGGTAGDVKVLGVVVS